VSEPRKLSIWIRCILWILSLLLTATVLVYQRMTGPTYSMPAKASIGSLKAHAKLDRTHGGDGGPTIKVTADSGLDGFLVWRRFPTKDEPTTIEMKRVGDTLQATLPHFPPAAKLEYVVKISDGKDTVLLNSKAAVLRYKADVPMAIVILHVLCIFLGLFFGLRAMFGTLVNEVNALRRVKYAVLFMSLGGLIFGPIMQKYAFGAYWTGWPLGEDLTDTKTLVGVLAWCVAWWLATRFTQVRRIAILLAFLVMLGVYMIPHSVRGSQYDWSKQQVETGK
jgi:hypothetical protein